MLRSRSQIRDALLLAMASVLAVDSFGPLSGGGGGGGRLGTARGLLGHLDPSENQVTAATASLDEKKRILPACGLRAEAASYSSCRKRAYRRACRTAKETGKALYRGRWYSARQMGVQYSPKQVQSVPVRLSATFRGTLGQAGRAGRLKILSWNSGAGNAGCLDEIDAYGVSENIDIICIQETRLQSESEWSTAFILAKRKHLGVSVAYWSWCRRDSPKRISCALRLLCGGIFSMSESRCETTALTF